MSLSYIYRWADCLPSYSINKLISVIFADKAEGPLLAGRADGVQPRFLETLHSWGLAHEVHEEGPLIDRTIIYRDGKLLYNNKSHQSDSRYRGLHIITQGQLERIYIRDLMRHKILVERSTVIDSFDVEKRSTEEYPVQASVRNERSGKIKTIRAKFLVGADGAGSNIRKQLNTPFDGVSTDIYWAIIDCVFETDFPFITVFGSVAHMPTSCVYVLIVLQSHYKLKSRWLHRRAERGWLHAVGLKIPSELSMLMLSLAFTLR